MVMPLIIILVVKFNILNETSNLFKLYRVTNDNIIAYTHTNTYLRAHTHTHTESIVAAQQKHLNILHIYDILSHVIFTA